MELKYICSQMVRVLHCNITYVNRKEPKCLPLMITIMNKNLYPPFEMGAEAKP